MQFLPFVGDSLYIHQYVNGAELLTDCNLEGARNLKMLFYVFNVHLILFGRVSILTCVIDLPLTWCDVAAIIILNPKP